MDQLKIKWQDCLLHKDGQTEMDDLIKKVASFKLKIHLIILPSTYQIKLFFENLGYVKKV